MINEEKSRELIGCGDWCESINKCNYKKTGINCYAYGIAMKMAEWKDHQFWSKENIEKIIITYNSFPDRSCPGELVKKTIEKLKP